MAGGNLPPEVLDKLMKTAEPLKESKQLKQLENNEFYTASINGMTLTVDKDEDVFWGISGSVDVTYGKSMPFSWTRGAVSIDGIDDEKIDRDGMHKVLTGGGLNFTLHLGGLQVNNGIAMFPGDDEHGNLERGYLHDVGLDSQFGIGIGAGAGQYIGNISEWQNKDKPKEESAEEGVFFG